MSDKIEELSKQYNENVGEHARSVGLFPIPEYPEYECQRGMLSTAFDVILTTLRYLAPATILTLFWGQQSFLFKFLRYVDSAFRTLVFSSEEQKQEILQWLMDAGPVRVDDLDVVWRHGWIICGILDSALPGACAGHPPTRLSLKHAQAIADHYLGVEPAFSRHELELNDSLSRHQEWRLINYLNDIRTALSKLTPPSRGNSQSSSKNAQETLFTLNYIARGSGLVAAQVNHKVYFKIYPTAQQSLDPGDINILIHGPKETYGMTVVPPVLGKAQLIRQNLLGLQSKSSYTENVLPITQGTTYLRSYGKTDMNKTYYIPKTKYDIDIETEIMPDHAKVGYVATLEGKYEISITSRGQNIVGSPFKVTASKNILGILERDSFCLEDGEEIDIVDIKTDKKVVLRIVDFVTEKMLLKENGCLEKITEEEAKYLMENDVIRNKDLTEKSCTGLKHKENLEKFYKAVNKVIAMNRVCKIFLDYQSRIFSNRNIQSVQTKHIPDIVNSTFYEENEMRKDYALSERRDRIIIPENISVSILTEKPLMKNNEASIHVDNIRKEKINSYLDDNYNTVICDPFEDDHMSIDTVQSSNNPFLCDVNDHTYDIAKQFGSFVPNEYESNNSQNEEIENANFKLFKENKYEIINETTNPFLDQVEIERPKTPVYKIITGTVQDREDSVYVNPEMDMSFVRTPSNDCMNPFIDEQENPSLYNDRPDFIIGAPVSLPPVINIPSSTPSSITLAKSGSIKTTHKVKDTEYYDQNVSSKERKISNSSNNSNLYSSYDSNLTEDVNITTNSSPTPSSGGNLHPNREMSPRKDTWDSAYVSIDENNCLSDSNISELSSDNLSKRKSQSSSFSKMGPAEKELWQNDYDLKTVKTLEDIYKHDIKRSEFTPIVEENEKSLKDVSGMKDETKNEQTDPVTEALGPLDHIYDEFETRSEASSVATTQESQSQNLGIDYAVESNKTRVDSASECKADVKRQTKILEGKISEIQARVTESGSASRILHAREKNHSDNVNEIKTERQFGDHSHTNIVLEKKKYWDEKIRQIEAKSAETKIQQHKRRMTLKHLRRNDSLSKRKGKKFFENFLNTGEDDSNKTVKPSITRSDTFDSLNDIEIIESENVDRKEDAVSPCNVSTCLGKSTTKNKEHTFTETLKQLKVSSDLTTSTDSDEQKSNSNLHFKQELPEKLFQAFETSPKRFFGTSRKHILNKIDTFLGLPDNENDKKKTVEDVSHESGLVSSRISLFHSISNTEELPWARRKCKSMYNINHQDSDKCTYTATKTATPKYSADLENNEYSKSIDVNFEKESSPAKENKTIMIQNTQNRSFDETLYLSSKKSHVKSNNFVKNTIQDLNKQNLSGALPKLPKLKSISKSEMDIFSKVATTNIDEDLEKHKSYEELPKINVKNFISLYEDVSRSSKTSPVRTVTRSNSIMSSKNPQLSSSTQGTAKQMSTSVNEIHLTLPLTTSSNEATLLSKRRKTLSKDKSFEIFSNDSESSSFDFEVISNQDKDANCLSFSDIEIEIIEKEPEKPVKPIPEIEIAHVEYKNRFTMAKKYFQSLEELRIGKTTKKSTNNNVLTSSQSTESLEEKKPRKRSSIKKSKSMPSSEIAKIWNQMQEEKEAESKKFVKISEKFNVDDLFEDVMEGRLSRQGSLRGIPHKKAVLETFRSMENVADSRLNSYELAVSNLNDFAHENKITKAQTYLSEYPYLPTTDPSKYHSRLDANASGLITLKELKKIPRRNSVPDLRLNPSFTADL